MIILLLPVLLEGFQVLLGERFLLDGRTRQTGGGFGGDLGEEIQEGVGVDVTGHHVDVILHHFYVRHRPLVQGGVRVKQVLEKFVTGLKYFSRFYWIIGLRLSHYFLSHSHISNFLNWQIKLLIYLLIC